MSLTLAMAAAVSSFAAGSARLARPIDGKPVDAVTFRAYLAFYQYDKGLPLDVKITDEAMVAEKQNWPAHRRINLSFMDPRDERVPATLWIPTAGNGPHACVFYLHGLGRTRADAMQYAGDLLRAGCAVMALDAAYHGERAAGKLPMYGANFYRIRDGYIQTVIDYRRAIDLLEARPDIDSRRLTLVGVSMGAINGSVLAGVDARVKCPVLLVGGADRGLMSRVSELSVWKTIRAENPHLDFDEVSRMLAPADPLNFVDKISPRPVLMINGSQDKIVPVQANKLLHATAKEPKKIIWLEAGHSLPHDQVVPLLVDWLKENL